MKNLCIALICVVVSCAFPAVASDKKKVLIIASNVVDMGYSEKHVVDQRIVSTMFLPSAALVAKEMLILMDKNGKTGRSKNN